MVLNCGVGEDSWESLDYKEIQPVHPKGNQSWIFIGKDWCWSWNSNPLATWCKKLTHLKRPRCWERLKAEGKGDDRGWDGWWHHQLNGHGFEQASGVGDRQGNLACCNPWGREGLDMTEQLNWTELKMDIKQVLIKSDCFNYNQLLILFCGSLIQKHNQYEPQTKVVW